MRSIVRRAATLALIATLTAGVCSAQRSGTDAGLEPAIAPAQTSGQIKRWIADLDADRFIARETATQRLIEAGQPAVQPISAAVVGKSLEVTNRGIYILTELALSDDPATEEAARAAIEQVAAANVTAAVGRATATLERLDEIRRTRSLGKIQQLGAVVQTTVIRNNTRLVRRVFVGIDPKWHGTEKDLVHLRWIPDLVELRVRGPQVTDAWLAQIGKMDQLQRVYLKRVKISAAGVAHLKGLTGLRSLSIWYSPIGDGAVEHLAAIQGASAMELYGTGITPQGAQRLTRALDKTTKIDCRQGGAFLGISVMHDESICLVKQVVPGAAAARAGVQSGDVIVKYGGEKVDDFKGLTKLIAENAPGETIAIEIRRGEKILTKQIALGEWDFPSQRY